MSSSSDRKWTCPHGVEMPEPEFTCLETKIWLPRRLTPLAHFDFKDPTGKSL